jgi:transmembrane sensor
MDNELSHDERIELAQYISTLSEEEIHQLPIVSVEEFDSSMKLSDEATHRILGNILKSSDNKKRKVYTMHLRTIAVAASIVIAACVGLYLVKNTLFSNNAVIAKSESIPMSQATSYTRHFELSDGSTVILKAGSRLICPTKFAGKTREVTLEGEAYFDIHHIDTKPFIIHSGNVKTTVLGTAFNINANAKQIIVTVTRGKVRVDKGDKELAILTKDEEIQCTGDESIVIKKEQTSEAQALQWVQQDVVFDHVTMGEAIQNISKRYGVNITIEDELTAQTVLFTSFSGTESLNEVLDVISGLLPGVSYSIDGNEVVISKNNN